MLEELKTATYGDLEDLVYRMQLTCNEVMYVLDIKLFPSKKQAISYLLVLMN